MDVLLASACLPTMFQAIKIDGEPYWDGGYSGNPTITPLIRECKSQDTILVQINPVERERSPRSASEFEVQRLFDDDIVEIDSVFYAPTKKE